MKCFLAGIAITVLVLAAVPVFGRYVVAGQGRSWVSLARFPPASFAGPRSKVMMGGLGMGYRRANAGSYSYSFARVAREAPCLQTGRAIAANTGPIWQ